VTRQDGQSPIPALTRLDVLCKTTPGLWPASNWAFMVQRSLLVSTTIITELVELFYCIPNKSRALSELSADSRISSRYRYYCSDWDMLLRLLIGLVLQASVSILFQGRYTWYRSGRVRGGIRRDLIYAWRRSLLNSLPPPRRLCFHFVCLSVCLFVHFS